MELPLFAILQRTPRVAVTLAFVLFLLTIVPALYSLLSNPILPLSISSSETDHPSPPEQSRFSHLDSPSNQIPSPENAPIPSPPDHTSLRHQISSFNRIPSPESGPVPAPPHHTPIRHHNSSSNQSPSPVNGPIPAPPHHTPLRHQNSSPNQSPSPVNGPISAPLNHTSLRHQNSSSDQSPSPVKAPIPAPLDHTPLRHRNPSSDQSPSPVNGPIPAPLSHTFSRHRKSSSDQSPSPVKGPSPAPLNHTFSRHQNSSPDQIPSSDNHSSPATTSTSRTRIRDDEQRCDLLTGEWVPNEEAPYYTNTTCSVIHEHQNCMKYGRPDTGFMRWRWKPDGCDLPVFEPQEFLETVRGKAMGFVGDSISRNQVQSLLCLLSRVEYPEDISSSPDTNFKVWKYTSYNFTLQVLWSPFLVKSTKPDPTHLESNIPFNLYLDEYDTQWTSQIDQLDYLVISSGHWFYRPVFFYENQQISGCQYCFLPNTTELPLYYGYRKALRISLRAILENFKGLAFLRSFSPQHFEGGAWNNGGDCARTRPYRRNETIPEAPDIRLHDIQLEEFRAAEEERRKKKTGLRLRLMDTTHAMLLRPDGHPGRYSHLQNPEVTLRNDCIHWCLPGPIDTWNDILLQMMKTEK